MTISLIPLGLFRSSLFITAYSRQLPKPIYQVECCKCKIKLILSHSELLALSKCNNCSILKNTNRTNLNSLDTSNLKQNHCSATTRQKRKSNKGNSESSVRRTDKKLLPSRKNSESSLKSEPLPNITYIKQPNGRLSRIITYKKLSLTPKEWANRLGVSRDTLNTRLHRFKDVNKALNLNYSEVKTYRYDGQYLSLPEIIQRSGVKMSRQTLYQRITTAGLSVKEALEIPVVMGNNQKFKKDKKKNNAKIKHR